jgi:tetratricopeptide (TPR) repeat protein
MKYFHFRNGKVCSTVPPELLYFFFFKLQKETEIGMDKTVQVQYQIRQNAEEISSYLRDLQVWEKKMVKKNSEIKKVRDTRNEKVREVGTVHVSSNPSTGVVGNNSIENIDFENKMDKNSSAAKHTYDVGYKKWENFDIEGALNDVEKEVNHEKNVDTTVSTTDSSTLTPATLITKQYVTKVSAPVSKARGVFTAIDSELAERELGNEEYKNGNFNNAIKHYTKCLGMKVKNYVAFSNRALAYIKLKEFIRAEADCNCALSIEPTHIKSLLRRATVRSALCKYRAAISDLNCILEIDPTNKQARSDLQKTKESLRSSVNKAPFTKIKTEFMDNGELLQGPTIPTTVTTEINQIEKDQSPVTDVDVITPSSPSINSLEIEKEFTKLVIEEDDSILSSQQSATSTSVTKKQTKKNNTTSTEVKKKVTPTKVKIPTIYELERNLRSISLKNEKELEKFFSVLLPEQASKICTNIMETDALYLFLTAINSYYLEMKNDQVKVIEWYEAIGKIPSFSLVKSLFTSSQQQHLKEILSFSPKLLELYGIL